MKSWKRPLIESLVLGSALTLSVIYVAQQQILVVLNWIGPVFFVPFHGAALLSGNAHEPSPWLFHTVLFLQFCFVVFILGWLFGRYRGGQSKAGVGA